MGTQRRLDTIGHGILAILRQHPGRTHALTVGQLQNQLLASSRVIRRAIQYLVVERRMPIASTVHPPYGFYLITNEEEARECLQQYWSRVREVRRRAQTLNAVVQEQFGINVQGEFEFET